jgi:hypothetical protein
MKGPDKVVDFRSFGERPAKGLATSLYIGSKVDAKVRLVVFCLCVCVCVFGMCVCSALEGWGGGLVVVWCSKCTGDWLAYYTSTCHMPPLTH